MEKLNLNFSNCFNVVKSILWILSILSWLFYIATGWASIKFFNEYEIIWTIKKIGYIGYSKYIIKEYYPIQIENTMIYIIFIITLIFAVVGFVIYIIKSIIIKDNIFYGEMMDIWPRLHSFPLILVSFLFLLGEYFYPSYINGDLEEYDYTKYFNHLTDINIFGLSFSLIALISLIFIYIVTDFSQDEWYVVLTVKKGAYSSLIILLWYYFCYMIYHINEFLHPGLPKSDRKYWKKTSGFIFSIIMGLGSLLFSFFFKDIVAACMNLLIYLGMTIFFFLIQRKERISYNCEDADGIIDIIGLILSAAMIMLLIIKYRKECLSSKIEKIF